MYQELGVLVDTEVTEQFSLIMDQFFDIFQHQDFTGGKEVKKE